MTSSLITAYLWNVILNSFLAFVTLTLVVEGVLTLFRVKSDRLKVLCRCLPILKLPFDLTLYDFSSWAMLRGLNPLSYESGSRFLTVEVGVSDSGQTWLPWWASIQMSLPDGWTFSLADIVIWSVNSLWLQSGVAIVLSVGIVWSIIRFRLFMRAWRHIRELCQRAVPHSRPIFNLRLARALVYNRVEVRVSDEVHMPFVSLACPKTIVFPNALLEQMDQAEYEAVLAHELEHLRWHDSWIRTLCSGISAFFWWVPTAGLRRRLDASQELSCDQAAQRYGIDNLVLGTAITKALHFAKPFKSACVASNFANPAQQVRRIEALVTPAQPPSRSWQLARGLIATLFMATLLFGRFWIF